MDHAYEEPLPNIKMECQKWTEEPLILRRSGTWYVEKKILSDIQFN